MDDLNVIDQFTNVFSGYIDSGFGLLAPDVAFLTTALISIDIVLAGLFWAMDGESNVIGQLIKKVLYVGFFALLLNNFQFLADVIFDSFAGLGLKATGTSLTAADLLKPGFVANTGFAAAMPLLEEANDLGGFPDFFFNAVTISVIMFAWAIVLLAFFTLAIQLFVTIIEFKLTTLAGFVLVPFALWNKTAFLSEKVLGNVVSSGIKLMVLAIIVGIGSTLFTSVTATFTPGNVTLNEAVAAILAAMALLALGIFGPGIATGLVAGAPQLGAGAAMATGLGVGAGAAAIGAGGIAAGRASISGGQSAIRAGAALAGGAKTAFSLGSAGQDGIAGAVSGTAGIARAAGSSAHAGFKNAVNTSFGNPREAFQVGADKAFGDTGGTMHRNQQLPEPANNNQSPDWARNIRRDQAMRDAGMAGAQVVQSGDRPGAGDGPSLKQDKE